MPVVIQPVITFVGDRFKNSFNKEKEMDEKKERGNKRRKISSYTEGLNEKDRFPKFVELYKDKSDPKIREKEVGKVSK